MSNATKTDKPIDLCLSGRGYRATALHLGVVTYLLVTGSLKKVQRVIAVSGGAITGASLVENFDGCGVTKANGTRHRDPHELGNRQVER